MQALILTRKGRGYALRTAWSASQAEVVAYMDVDLSTSLPALLPLVGSVLSGHSDLAVGTRLARGARVVRGPKRELISRAYSHIVRLSLRSRVSDFQCGFKAIRRARALQILPLVGDDEWFFDTELIVDGRASRGAHRGDASRVDRRSQLVGGHRRHRTRRPPRDLADRTSQRARARTHAHAT